MLWLWHRPAAAAPIGPLALEHPYASGAALGKEKRKKKRKKEHSLHRLLMSVLLLELSPDKRNSILCVFLKKPQEALPEKFAWELKLNSSCTSEKA